MTINNVDRLRFEKVEMSKSSSKVQVKMGRINALLEMTQFLQLARKTRILQADGGYF